MIKIFINWFFWSVRSWGVERCTYHMAINTVIFLIVRPLNILLPLSLGLSNCFSFEKDFSRLIFWCTALSERVASSARLFNPSAIRFETIYVQCVYLFFSVTLNFAEMWILCGSEEISVYWPLWNWLWCRIPVGLYCRLEFLCASVSYLFNLSLVVNGLFDRRKF